MKFFFKCHSSGALDMFELDLSLEQQKRIRQEILDESGSPPEPCFFFSEQKLWHGSRLSEHILEIAQSRKGKGGDSVDPQPEPTGTATSEGEMASAGEGGADAASGKSGWRRGSKRRMGGYSSWEEGLAGFGHTDQETSGNSDGGGQVRATAARAAVTRAANAEAAANRARSSKKKGSGNEVFLRLWRLEAALLSKDVEWRWLEERSTRSKKGMISVINPYKKTLPTHLIAPPEPPVCLLFPGEGCQYQGMCSILQSVPAVLNLFRRASRVLGYDAAELINFGQEWRLSQTRYCQPLLFLASYCALEKLKIMRRSAAAQFTAVCGYGIGQLIALSVAGVLGFEDMLRLIQIRAEAMEEVCRQVRPLQCVVAGLESTVMREICLKAEQLAGPPSICRIGHFYMPNGFTICGSENAVLLAMKMCEESGADMVRVMNSQTAAESIFMAPACAKYFDALHSFLPIMKPPTCSFWSTVRPSCFPPGCDPAEIVEDLKAHVTQPVLWEAAMLQIQHSGVETFYEMAPKRFIKSMNSRISRKLGQMTHNIHV